MPLPDLIEIVPLTAPVRAEITVPGSKSITNRALILAALAEGETVLRGALWSEDTQVMVECLQELGFMINVAPDPEEFCNRTITVYGQGGHVPRGGTEQQPLELFVQHDPERLTDHAIVDVLLGKPADPQIEPIDTFDGLGAVAIVDQIDVRIDLREGDSIGRRQDQVRISILELLDDRVA